MKPSILFLLVGLFALTSAAQTPTVPVAPTKPLAITGGMTINFATRSAEGKTGVVDTYTISINVANSALFKGTVTQLPFIHSYVGANQAGKLTYALDTDVINPANPSQTVNVGKLFGTVPVDEHNVYRFDDGFLKINVNPRGKAAGFESRFTGLAIGKPPQVSGVAKIRQDTLRLVSGKGGAVTLKNYDIMRFQNIVLAAGPVQIYPEVTMAGDMPFDYDRSIWYWRNVTASYGINGQRMFDTLTGSIRWIEDPARKTNGLGHYEFDLRLNEPPPSESAVFGGTSDEASFFETDTSIPGLTGVISYKDTMNGDTVTGSVIEIDLHGNRLTKQQMMYLAKLIFLVILVPFNAE